jgi:hypothetical protein
VRQLCQGLADGFFVLHTLSVLSLHEIQVPWFSHRTQVFDVLQIRSGTHQHADEHRGPVLCGSFPAQMGKVMWDMVGMART